MKGLLAQLEELAWNLLPGPFSLIPDLAEEPVSSSGSRDDSLQGWAAGWGWLLHPHGVAWTSQGGSSSSLGQKWEASSGLTPSVLCPHARGCCSLASGKGTWKSSTLSTTLTQSGCLLPWPFTHVTAPTHLPSTPLPPPNPIRKAWHPSHWQWRDCHLLPRALRPGTGVPRGLGGEGRQPSAPCLLTPRPPPFFQIASQHQSRSHPTAGSDTTALL